MPGFPIRVKEASEDYVSLCLVADESFTAETPSIRNAVRSALLPIFEMRQPVVGISHEESVRLSSLILMAGEYLVSENPMREEMHGNLYAIFLMDLSSILSKQTNRAINYADSTTFGRFFFRMKGVTPREYRKGLFKISS